ncbi:archaeosortase/exosortase family protein [Candidatus Micrarchaeota archaeon]|nr:archaeosortase/exosortase family protein [Candidatus Micrarchaeota archaeon]
MRRKSFSRQKPSAKAFLLKFFALFAVLFAAVYYAPLSFLTDFIAFVESVLLNLVGMSVISAGSLVISREIVFQIVNECTGLVMLSMLAALLYATPSISRREKILGLALFAIPLLLFNLARLFLTMLVGISFGQGALDSIHFILWILDALVVFLVWMHLSKTGF